jgi:transketolase
MELRYNGKKSELGMSQCVADTLLNLIAEDDAVVYLDADMMRGLKLLDAWKKDKNHFIQCGIQEANMVGVASGFALAGRKPFCHTFAPFITRRNYDTTFLSGAYAQTGIRLLGSDGGILSQINGGTHTAFEDLALICAMPTAIVADPTDNAMMRALMRATKDLNQVVYLRVNRSDNKDVYLDEQAFSVGKGLVLREGNDLTIVACGIMVYEALEACKLLEAEGISVRLIDPVTIKPLDEELILKAAAETGAIVTAENHNVIGGLGAMVAAAVCENIPVPVVRVGAKDRFGQVGPLDFLKTAFQLDVSAIVRAVKQSLSMKNN